MDLETELLKEHSKQNMLRISKWIGNDPSKFKKLMHVFLYGEKRSSQIAGYAFSICAEKNAPLMIPYMKQLAEKLLDKNAHSSSKRHITKSFLFAEIPDEYAGIVVQTCFDFLENKTEEVAVRANCMELLYQFTQKEPDLKNELYLYITENLDEEKPAFKSRGNKILKAIYGNK